MFGESLKFFDLPTTKWRPFNFFVKLNGNHMLMANFSKLRKYQTFGLTELHSLNKGQSADRILKSCKSCVYDYRAVNFWNADFLIFFNFQTTFVKNFMKKLAGFKTDFEVTDKILPLHQYLWSEILDNETTALWNFFLKFARKREMKEILKLWKGNINFVKWRKY